MESDILTYLSYALHDDNSSIPVLDEETKTSKKNTQLANPGIVLANAAEIINDILHQQIKKEFTCTDISKFSVDASISNLNSDLWEFMCSCTKSIRERVRQDDNENFIKKIRRLAIISLMMTGTNVACNTALHHLIAETVEVCGGSRKLIRILNRIGFCVSADTHDRLVTCVAEEHMKTNIWEELSDQIFTIASADNIDFLKSHAAVYCGNQGRSYHGTTIQLVQPVPSILSNDSHIPFLSKRLLSNSPSHSPHKPAW
jgi:hypothetical protein